MIWIFIIWLIGALVCAAGTTVLAFDEKEYTLHALFDDITICLGSWVSVAFGITKFFVDDRVLFKHNDEEL